VLIKLLLLISDPVLSVGTANESVYAIFSLSEPEGMAVIVKEVGESMALVVWGEPGTLGTSFGIRWSAAERAAWVIDRVPPYLLAVIVGLIFSDCHLWIVRGGS